nr:chemotaxis protein CheW [uncultured Pseudomonas sp.]
MLEEGRDLARTEIELALAADQPIPGNYYLSLVVAGEMFAVSALNVCALVEASQFISESSTTSSLRRAIRWRDTLVPVIVLSQHLVERPLESSWSSCVVILELIRDDSRQRVGAMVDAVGKVLEIHPADIEPPVTDDSQACSDVLLGMATVGQHRVGLLHVERGLWEKLRSAVFNGPNQSCGALFDMSNLLDRYAAANAPLRS